jgi:predicted transcriptional regulator
VPAHPVAVKLDPEVYARVRHLAETRDRSAHYLLREAISQYVEREEKRQAFREDALRAWEAYRADGLHVDDAEADAWMARLEAGDDVEPPECHD